MSIFVALRRDLLDLWVFGMVLCWVMVGRHGWMMRSECHDEE